VAKNDDQPVPWFLADVAIDTPKADEFDHGSIAKELVEAIRCAPPAACIGLIGSFGTGKTSISNLARRQLRNDPKHDAVHVSADRHSGAARSRNIVQAVASELQRAGWLPPQDVSEALRPLTRSVKVTAADPTDTPFLRLVAGQYNVRKLAIPWAMVGAAILFAIAGLVIGGSRWGEAATLVASGLSATGLAALIWAAARKMVASLFDAATLEDAVPRAEATDDVERVFVRLIEHHARRRKNRRLVIFIDDVDRLDKKDVLDALRVIKSLQAVPKGQEPIFVVSCDEAIVREAIRTGSQLSPGVEGGALSSDGKQPRTGSDQRGRDSAAEAFLDKFFALRITLPPHIPGDMRVFAQAALRTSHPLRLELGEKLDAVIAVLVSAEVTAPRDVIKRLNEFLSSYRLAQEREAGPVGESRVHPGDITDEPELLARLTVLKLEHPSFFADVVQENVLLQAADRLLLGQPLTPTQLDTLVRADLAEASEDSPPEWKGDPALRRYLLETARLVPRYPTTLTPLIYFSHTASGRVLGNERVAQLLTAVRGGDAEHVAQAIADAPTDLHATVAQELAEMLKRSARIDAPNVIAGAGAAVANLQAGAETVANGAADLLRTFPETKTAPETVVALLEAAAPLYVDSLRDVLVGAVESEDASDRNRRMLVALSYLARHPDATKIRAALIAHLGSLDEEAGWDVGRLWMEQAAELDRETHRELVDDFIVPALVKLVREARDFDLSADGDRFVALAASARVTAVEAVSKDVAAITTENPVLLTLMVRLLEAFEAPHLLETAVPLTTAATTHDVALGDRRSALRRLVDSSDKWAKAKFRKKSEEDEAARISEWIASKVAAVLPDAPDQFAVEAATAVERLAATAANDTIGPVLQPLLGRAQPGGTQAPETAFEIADHLAAAVAHLPEDDAVEVADRLLAPLGERGDVADASVQQALGLIDRFAGSDQGRDALTRNAAAWRQVMTAADDGRDVQLAAFRRLATASPEIVDSHAGPMWAHLTTRLSQGANVPNQLHAIAHFVWPQAQLADALRYVADRWDDLDRPDEAAALAAISRGVQAGVEIPEPLLDRLVEAIVENPASDLVRVADEAWSVIPTRGQYRIMLVTLERAETHKRLASLESAHLAAVTQLAVSSGQLDALLAVKELRRDVLSEAATASLVAFTEGGRDTDPAVIETFVDQVADDSRSGLVDVMYSHLPADNPTAENAAEVLASLRSHGVDIEPDRAVPVAIEMLNDATARLAHALGRLVSGAPQNKELENLLKRLRKDRREIGLAFDAGREGKAFRAD
jgi:hypothetical protein